MRQRALRNTLLSAVSEGSNAALFLLGFLAARTLEPTAFGQYSAAFAFVGLFRMLPDFGMSYASTLAISRDRSLAGRLVGNLLGFQAALSVVTVALCLGIGRALFDGVTWTAVLLLSADVVLKALKTTLRWLLKGMDRFAAESVSLLLERLGILLCGSLSLVHGYGVIGFVLAFVGVRLVETMGVGLFIDRRVLPLRPHYDPGAWWELFRKGLPFAYAGLMITLFFQVDAVMLARMRDAREVGFYRAPVLVLEGLTLVPRVLGFGLIPTMAGLAASRPGTITKLYRRASEYLLLVGLPIGAFALVMADPFIRFVFGPDYGPSAIATQILLPSVLFMFLSNFGETVLACIDRWRTIVVVSTLCLLLNVGLNLLWIPRHGFEGAAWATLATEGCYFLLTALALQQLGHSVSWPRVGWRPLLATGAFTATLLLARGLPLLLAAALASLAWGAVVLVLFRRDLRR